VNCQEWPLEIKLRRVEKSNVESRTQRPLIRKVREWSGAPGMVI